VPSQSRLRERGREDTLIERVYSSIITSIESGSNVEAVLTNYMPLLLNEIEVLSLTYPEVREVFKETVEKLWIKWFKDIPMPGFEESDSATAVVSKVEETLKNNVRKLTMGRYFILMKSDVDAVVKFTTLQFIEAVVRRVFKLFGVLR